jgi:hypothetical protein
MTPWAEEEYYKLEDIISNQYKAPLTAKRYMHGLSNRISSLMTDADVYADVPELSVEFGMIVKRLNYKQIAIIYTFEEDKVYIQRVLPQKMVIY